MAWVVERHHEPAATFHGRSVDAPAQRAVWQCDPTGPALVLGSTQPEGLVDQLACARADVAVVRRRSGGGAVFVEPDGLLWLDVVVPAGDPLWDVDVGRAFLWLGDVWAAALADLGVVASVHHGALVRAPWSDVVCFAGLGPGEVTGASGAKLVGISQRRTRDAARFQCAALLRWDPVELLRLLALDDQARGEAAVELGPVATGVGVDPAELLGAFLRHLP